MAIGDIVKVVTLIYAVGQCNLVFIVYLETISLAKVILTWL